MKHSLLSYIYIKSDSIYKIIKFFKDYEIYYTKIIIIIANNQTKQHKFTHVAYHNLGQNL